MQRKLVAEEYFFLIIGYAFGFYMAWNIGANDVANSMASALWVSFATWKSLPVSTTHAAVGGLIGVGLAHGFEAVHFTIVFHLMIYWVLTVPASALTIMAIFKILEFIIQKQGVPINACPFFIQVYDVPLRWSPGACREGQGVRLGVSARH